MYKLCSNRIFRVLICLLFSVVFVVVPIEHKMLTAQAALTASMAIAVICAILVAMGFTFGRVFLSESIDSQFSKMSIAETAKSMGALARDIWDNCPDIAVAILGCFPFSQAFATRVQIVQVSSELYRMIKKYVIDKYGDSDGIEDSLLKATGYVGDCFMVGKYVFYSSDTDASAVPGYSSINVDDYSFYWEFDSLIGQKYRYYACKSTASGTSKINWYDVQDPGTLYLVGEYVNIYAPSSQYPNGYFNARIYYCLDGKSGPFTSASFSFNSLAEYELALKASAGETDPDKLQKPLEIDDAVFDASVSDYPRYVYVHENLEDYIGMGVSDVAAPAYDEVVDSNVVNAVARTVTWQGDRTLCPIDDLESSLPAAVIGHWVATWDEVGTLCNISCYAEDGTVAWSGSVATTLTWADVLAKLGDISISGAIAGAGAIALPDTVLDWDKLKFAGQTFTTKFPFCLPFDLYNGFKQLGAGVEGRAPVFTIPLKMGFLGDYTQIIDLSQFNKQAAIVKWFFYLLFMFNLVVITKKVMGGGS